MARMAAEYRYTFGTDVIIDLIGYRRHGHSEVDDPTVTQPLLYRKSKDHPADFLIYAQRTQQDAAPIVERIRGEYQQSLSAATATAFGILDALGLQTVVPGAGRLLRGTLGARAAR